MKVGLSLSYPRSLKANNNHVATNSIQRSNISFGLNSKEFEKYLKKTVNPSERLSAHTIDTIAWEADRPTQEKKDLLVQYYKELQELGTDEDHVKFYSHVYTDLAENWKMELESKKD